MLIFGEQPYNQPAMADPLASWMWISLTAPPPPPPEEMPPMADHVFVNMDVADRSVPKDEKVQLSAVSLDENLEVVQDRSGPENENVQLPGLSDAKVEVKNMDFQSIGKDNKSGDEKKGNLPDAGDDDNSWDGTDGLEAPSVLNPTEDRPWIWKVHSNIKKNNKEAYEPKIISIGPFHHGKMQLKPMEEIKLKYVRLLLGRSPKNSWRNYFRIVHSNEDRARKQYKEKISMGSKGFTKMLVTDACFMIEYFLREYLGEKQIHSDHLVGMEWSLDTFKKDLMLLENQIPYFILDKLFQALVIPNSISKGAIGKATPSLITIALKFLELERFAKDKFLTNNPTVHHLLHLKYLCMAPSVSPQAKPLLDHLAMPILQGSSLLSFVFYGLLYVVLIKCLGRLPDRYFSWYWKKGEYSKITIPSAYKLHNFGVKFESTQSVENGSYLNVTFSDDGVLTVPRFFVELRTISELRNLIAFERDYDSTREYFMEYAIFMDNIIKSGGDIIVLRKYGIIETTSLEDYDFVMKTFTTLLKGTNINRLTMSSGRIGSLFKSVNKYCDIPQHQWRATLRSSHLQSRWATFSLVSVIVTIVTAVIQTSIILYGNRKG